jgi:hypothetical protein
MRIPIILAEVLDKEPNLSFIWLVYGALALGGFWLCRIRWWWFAVIMPISGLAAWGGMSELWDRSVGPEIFRESPSLFLQWQFALLLSLVGPSSGFILGLGRRGSSYRRMPTV